MKGFVFVAGHLTYLRFVLTHAFDEIEAQHDMIYVSIDVQENRDLSEWFARKKVRVLPYYPRRYASWKQWFNVSCYHFQDRSPSFAVRIAENYKDRPKEVARFKQVSDRYQQAKADLRAQNTLHPDLLELCLRERPDFFLLPSPILDSITDDVIQVANALNIPTLLLVAGWDNLSSKGLLFDTPTMTGVWGEQSAQHAQIVQEIPRESVRVIGAPHYEIFRQDNKAADRAALRQAWSLSPEQQVVLFAGTFRLFDETQVLRDLEEAINNGEIPPMQLIYRPHPWRTHRPHEQNFYDFEWQHITMDPAMADIYREGQVQASDANTFLFEQTHLRDLYCLVDAVICPMSTVLLESMLFGLPILAVAFGDGKHSWSADKVSEMMHFKELYEIPEVIVCREREQFMPAIQRLMATIPDQEARHRLQASTDYFVHLPLDSTYAQRVVGMVEQMVQESTSKPRYGSVGLTFPLVNRVRNEWRYNRRIPTLRQQLDRLKARIRARLGRLMPGS